jgi:hypothetical protein
MFRRVPLFFCLGVLWLPHLSQAQVPSLSIGPRLGLNFGSSVRTSNEQPSVDIGLPGVEAGLAASWTAGHWSLEPALLYSRKGYTTFYESVTPGGSYAPPNRVMRRDTVHLHYITLPLDVAYALRSDGQGFRVFGGAYVACLLGGRVNSWIAGTRGSSRSTSKVGVAESVPPLTWSHYA